jgi:hypothetical protein
MEFIMALVKELYIEMIDCATECLEQGLNEQQTLRTLESEFGIYGQQWGETIVVEAVDSLQAFHNDMMQGANSHNEEQYFEG